MQSYAVIFFCELSEDSSIIKGLFFKYLPKSAKATSLPKDPSFFLDRLQSEARLRGGKLEFSIKEIEFNESGIGELKQVALEEGYLIAAFNKAIKILNPKNAEEIAHFDLSGDQFASFIVKGDCLVVFTFNNIQIWSLSKKQRMEILHLETQILSRSLFLEENKIYIPDTGEIYEYDLSSRKLSEFASFYDNFESSPLIYHVKNGKIYVGNSKEGIQVFDASTKEKIDSFKDTSQTISALLVLDDGTIIAGTENGKILVRSADKKCAQWNTQPGQESTGFMWSFLSSLNPKSVLELAYLDGKIFTLSLNNQVDCDIMIWELDTGKLLKQLKSRYKCDRTVHFSYDGKMLALIKGINGIEIREF